MTPVRFRFQSHETRDTYVMIITYIMVSLTSGILVCHQQIDTSNHEN